MNRTLAVSALALTAAISSAAPAHADQDSFLNQLRADGVVMTHENVLKVLTFGQAVCDAMYADAAGGAAAEQHAISGIVAKDQDDPRLVRLFVAAAHSQLCPDA